MSSHLVWLPIAPLLVGLLAGAAAGVTGSEWPDWDGTEPQNISNSETALAWQPAIAASPSGRMAAAWSDQRSEGAQRDVYALVSNDNGHSWPSSPQQVSDTEAKSRHPDVVIAGDQIFAAWVEGYPPTAIYEAEIGTEEAHRVPSPVQLTHTRPRLAVGADRLHVVFNAGAGSPDVLHAARPLTATAWTTATTIYTHTASMGSWFPAIAVGPDGRILHVVWEERAGPARRAVRYMSGTLGGGWWPSLSLSTGITRSVYPAIGADCGGNVHVVWGELAEEGNYVRYRRYDAASGLWFPLLGQAAARIDPEPVEVHETTPTDLAPALALTDRGGRVTICAAWHGFRKGVSPEAEEILVSCSQDGGQNWSPTQSMSRRRAGGEVCIWPSIVFDGSQVLHGAWQQRVDQTSHYEIYHAYALSKAFLPLVTRNG